jgi:hypothetical protein
MTGAGWEIEGAFEREEEKAVSPSNELRDFTI